MHCLMPHEWRLMSLVEPSESCELYALGTIMNSYSTYVKWSTLIISSKIPIIIVVKKHAVSNSVVINVTSHQNQHGKNTMEFTVGFLVDMLSLIAGCIQISASQLTFSMWALLPVSIVLCYSLSGVRSLFEAPCAQWHGTADKCTTHY